METVFVVRIRDIIKNKKELEKSLGVKIGIVRNKVTFSGNGLNEYVAQKVFDAINFGFSVKRSLLLVGDDCIFRVVHIKDHTKRNLRDVKARLIGKKGKTKRIFSSLSNCEILIKESEVGIIGDAESVEDAETVIVNLIKGAKQSHMYSYLEKRNKDKKEITSF